MSYDYAQYQTYLATMMATTTTDPNFVAILPMCIDYAEQRIYRELDLLNTRVRDSTQACTAGTRLVNLPSQIVVLETLAVITPAGSQPSAGTRNILTAVTHDFMDLTYPNDAPSAYQAMPLYYAMVTQTTALVGPSPDAAYVLEAVCTERPAPLSAGNTTTVLTDMLPDLFMAGSLIWMASYQKNFGAASDDPKMAQSWEAQYAQLMTWAKSEEFRKKLEASSWTPMIQSSAADRQRG